MYSGSFCSASTTRKSLRRWSALTAVGRSKYISHVHALANAQSTAQRREPPGSPPRGRCSTRAFERVGPACGERKYPPPRCSSFARRVMRHTNIMKSPSGSRRPAPYRPPSSEDSGRRSNVRSASEFSSEPEGNGRRSGRGELPLSVRAAPRTLSYKGVHSRRTPP